MSATAEDVGLQSRPQEVDTPRYADDIFISYAEGGDWVNVMEGKRRHVVAVLKRALERHRHPVSRKRFRACTFVEDMGLGKDLQRTIAQHLGQSRCLLVICDESSQGSYWVKWEIDWFRARRREALQPESSALIGATLRLSPADAFPHAFDPSVRCADLSAKADMFWNDYRSAIEMQSHQIVAWAWDLDLRAVRDRFEADKRRTRRLGLAIAIMVVLLVAMSAFGYRAYHRAIALDLHNDAGSLLAEAEKVPNPLTSPFQETLVDASRRHVESTLLTIESLEHAYTLPAHQRLIELVRALPPVPDYTWHVEGLVGLALSQDDRWLATGVRNEVLVWSLHSAREAPALVQRLISSTPLLEPHEKSLTFSQDGAWLAVACPPKVCLWRTADWTLELLEVEGVSSTVELQFSPDDTRLAMLGHGRGMSLIDLTTRRTILFDGEPRWSAMSFSSDGRRLLVVGPKSCNYPVQGESPLLGKVIDSLTGAVVTASDADRTKQELFVGASNTAAGVTHMELIGGQPWLSFLPRASEWRRRSLVLSSSGQYLLAPPLVWNLWGSRPQEILTFPDPNVLLRITKDHRLIAGSGDRVSMIDIRGSNVDQARLEPAMPGQTSSAAFSADGRRLVSCSGNEVVLREFRGNDWSSIGAAQLGDRSSNCSGIALDREGKFAVIWSGPSLFAFTPPRSIERIELSSSDVGPHQAQQGRNVLGAAISDDGSRIAAHVADRLELVDRTSLQKRVSVAFEERPERWSFGPGSHLLALVTQSQCKTPGRLYVVDADTGHIDGWRPISEELRHPVCQSFVLPPTIEPEVWGDPVRLDAASSWFIPFSSLPIVTEQWEIGVGRPGEITERSSGRTFDLVLEGGGSGPSAVDPSGRWWVTAGTGHLRIWPLMHDDLVERARHLLSLYSGSTGRFVSSLRGAEKSPCDAPRSLPRVEPLGAH